MSLWESLADMQAYEQSALYREIMAPLQPFFVGEYKTYRSEVKYTDITRLAVAARGGAESPLLGPRALDSLPAAPRRHRGPVDHWPCHRAPRPCLAPRIAVGYR